MNKTSIMKLAAAIALLFAVNMEADAQFGKLKGLAKKAKEAVTQTTTIDDDDDASVLTPASSSGGEGVTSDEMSRRPDETDEQYRRRIRRIWDKDQPQKLEIYDVEEAGGLQQYLGLTEGDGLLFWKFYEDRGKGNLNAPGFMLDRLIDLLRLTKNPYYDTTEGQKHPWTRNPHDVEMWLGYVDAQGKLQGRALNDMNTAQKTMTAPCTKAEMNAMIRFLTKSLTEFEAKYGKIHK